MLDRNYDVCVIGSGPGGAVAASTLAAAGLDVVLIERGPFRPPKDFTFQALDMATRLGHVELTRGYRTALLQGNVLGGGSIIYGAVAMRPPAAVWNEWQAATGLDDVSAEAFEPHYAEVGAALSVTRQSTALENRPNAIVREMAHALGRPEGLARGAPLYRGLRRRRSVQFRLRARSQGDDAQQLPAAGTRKRSSDRPDRM